MARPATARKSASPPRSSPASIAGERAGAEAGSGAGAGAGAVKSGWSEVACAEAQPDRKTMHQAEKRIAHFYATRSGQSTARERPIATEGRGGRGRGPGRMITSATATATVTSTTTSTTFRKYDGPSCSTSQDPRRPGRPLPRAARRRILPACGTAFCDRGPVAQRRGSCCRPRLRGRARCTRALADRG